MAEWSLGWTTNGTGDGVAGGYTESQWTFKELFNWVGDAADEGVFRGSNELAVSASGGSASPVSIAAGAGMASGYFYYNSAAGTLNIPTPAGSTRVDRVVLQAHWGSQVVRFRRVAGAEGAGTPALTQSAGSVWEVPLATVSITTGGVATVTDGRVYVHPNIKLETGNLEDLTVTTAKIVNSAVTKLKIENRTRSFFVLADFGGDIAGLDLSRNSLYGWELDEGVGTAGYSIVTGHSVIPEDYVSGFSAKLLMYHGGAVSGTAYLGNQVRYIPTVNGAYTVATAWKGLQDFVAAEAQYQSTAVVLSGIAAGDTVYLRGQREAGTATDTLAGTLFSPGWKVSYTADG